MGARTPGSKAANTSPAPGGGHRSAAPASGSPPRPSGPMSAGRATNRGGCFGSRRLRSLSSTSINSWRPAPRAGNRGSGKAGGQPRGRSRAVIGVECEDVMKAIVQDTYGSAEALYLADVDRPAPADGEVLVRVGAAGLC